MSFAPTLTPFYSENSISLSAKKLIVPGRGEESERKGADSVHASWATKSSTCGLEGEEKTDECRARRIDLQFAWANRARIVPNR